MGRANGVVRVCKSEEEEEKKKSVYADRKVFASFFRYRKPITWIEIDPHLSSGDLENHRRSDSNCFHVDGNPKINSPPLGLAVSSLIYYSDTLVVDSKAYFIGGQYHKMNGGGGGGDTNDDDDDDDADYYYSDDDDDTNIILSGKMFIYHLLSNKWEESPSQLNIPRTSPAVVYVAAQKLIYVFGGRLTFKPIHHNMLKKEHWIECFSLDPDHKSATKWEFLPYASAPPDPVLEDFRPVYHFLYERGTQIVFFLREAGFYSFNYVTQTWAPFLSNLNLTEEARVKCFRVVVIDHLLFWHFEGVIYAYNLMNDRLVLSQVLDQLKMSFATPPPFPFYWPSPSFLERIGDDTLILVARNCDTDSKENDLHFYKFQIQNLTPEEPPHAYNNNLQLVQIGFGVFSTPGDALLNVLAV